MNFKKICFQSKNWDYENFQEITARTPNWGLLPILEWNNELVTDSPNISRFIEKMTPQPTIYPNECSPEICDIINGWSDTKMGFLAAKYLVKEFLEFLPTDKLRDRYRKIFSTAQGMTPEQAMTNRNHYKEELFHQWMLLENILSQRSYVLGQEISYGDFGIASRFRLMEIVAGYKVPSQFPKLASWYETIKRLDLP